MTSESMFCWSLYSENWRIFGCPKIDTEASKELGFELKESKGKVFWSRNLSCFGKAMTCSKVKLNAKHFHGA